MKKRTIFLIHSLFWLGNLLLFLVMLGIICQSKLIEESEGLFYAKLAIGLVAAPGVFCFYSFYLYLFPKFFQKKNVSQSIIVGLLISFSSFFVGALALYFLLGFTLACYKESDYIAPFVIAFIGGIYGLIALVIKGFITWYQEIVLKEELQERNHKMEMALVKSQLDPHFLFNTLNNIDVLIIKDADQASLYLNKLSDIMRFMLFETKAEFIPLQKEITYIEKYIELQRIRTANPNYINYQLSGSIENRLIAPMIFIPFIENAFKHATNKKIENAINLKIEITNDQFVFYCDNSFDPLNPLKENSHGLGNELIQRRLELIYPEKHELKLDIKDDRYFVKLSIDHDKL